MVKEKYAKTFLEVLGTTQLPAFNELKWGEKEFELVVEAQTYDLPVPLSIAIFAFLRL